MQTVPPQALSPGETFKIDVGNYTPNPVKGIVAINNSGYSITVSFNGNNYTVPAGMNDWLPTTPISGAVYTFVVSSSTSAPLAINPSLQVNIYEVNDPDPTGYPMVNPAYVQSVVTATLLQQTFTIPASSSGKTFVGTQVSLVGYDAVVISTVNPNASVLTYNVETELGVYSFYTNSVTGASTPHLLALDVVGTTLQVNVVADDNNASSPEVSIFGLSTNPSTDAPYYPSSCIVDAQSVTIPASGSSADQFPTVQLPGRYLLWAFASVTSRIIMQRWNGLTSNWDTIWEQTAAPSGGDVVQEINIPPDDVRFAFTNTSTVAGTGDLSVTGPT